MTDDDAPKLSYLERQSRLHGERIRQREMIRAMRRLEAKQAELLALAARGVADKAREKAAGASGGREPKVAPEQLAAAVDRYLKQHPHDKVSAAVEAVALDHGVSARTVHRARSKRPK